MIYTRMGMQVEIVKRNGEHLIPRRSGQALPYHFCKAKLTDPDEGTIVDRPQILETLKADGGWDEIFAAYNAAPEEEIPPRQAKAIARNQGIN